MKKLSKTDSLPRIIRAENTLDLISNTEIYNVFSSFSFGYFSTSASDYIPLYNPFLSIKPVKYPIPVELIHFISKDAWGHLCAVVTSRIQKLKNEPVERLLYTEPRALEELKALPTSTEEGAAAHQAQTTECTHEAQAERAAESAQRRRAPETAAGPAQRRRAPERAAGPAQQPRASTTITAKNPIPCIFEHEFYSTDIRVDLNKVKQVDGSCLFKSQFHGSVVYFYSPGENHPIWNRNPDSFEILDKYSKPGNEDLFANYLKLYTDKEVYYKLRPVGARGDCRYHYTAAKTFTRLFEENKKGQRDTMEVHVFALSAVDLHGHTGSGKAKR